MSEKFWRDGPVPATFTPMHEDGSLNLAQKTRFDRDGYVMLPGFASPAEVGEALGVLAKFIHDKVPGLTREHVFYEDKSRPDTLKQLQSLFLYEPYFDALMFRSKFAELAELLLGTPAVGKNMQYFNKPPGIGQPTPPHQDVTTSCSRRVMH